MTAILLPTLLMLATSTSMFIACLIIVKLGHFFQAQRQLALLEQLALLPAKGEILEMDGCI